MSAKIIDGKLVSAAVREKIKNEVEGLDFKPGLSVIIVGENPASQVYVRNKKRAAIEVGFDSNVYEMPESTTQAELDALIDKLNADPAVHGILVQLPLPKHLDEREVTERIVPEKDVDAFHAVNCGYILQGNARLLPCTPAGVMEMLDYYSIPIEGKNCVVVGRSNIVGKPMALLLLGRNGTVTVCHSRTKDLAEITKKADILVAAVGKAKLITADMVADGAVVIDVGMNRDENGKLCGDVDFASVSEKASYITPVPGGVGPMTISILLKNTLSAALDIKNKK